MVDIIRRGENIIECSSCGSTLRYYPGDIQQRYNGQGTFWYTTNATGFGNTNSIYPSIVYFITCPVCETDIYVNGPSYKITYHNKTGDTE